MSCEYCDKDKCTGPPQHIPIIERQPSSDPGCLFAITALVVTAVAAIGATR